MPWDDRVEKIAGICLGIVGIVAICANLVFKAFTIENVLDAVKDVAGAAVPFLVFIVALQLRQKEKTFRDTAEKVLKKIQSKYEDYLVGPEYSKSGYVPDKEESSRKKYLFLRREMNPKELKRKVAFIPLDPLEQGILDVRVAKSTILALGYTSKSSDVPQLIETVQRKVCDVVERRVQTAFAKHCSVLYGRNSGSLEVSMDAEEAEPSTSATVTKFLNSAIVVDFDEEALGHRRFASAVQDIAEVALQALLEFQRRGIS
ncbi:MAG TPA: hypothetical protein PLO37_16055 [Candidatus Hydrogenedentes bacterium]|nr:hypothetical protein [Candidatus Hydrogenedentota bacterium]HPG68359.1 hypothetical protein [Candidatus Hydrogenedentota bacterium]